MHPEWDRGNFVMLYYGGHYGAHGLFYYCHAEELYVVLGQTVLLDTPLGKMGNTGYTNGGKHWHVRHQIDGVDRDWVREGV